LRAARFQRNREDEAARTVARCEVDWGRRGEYTPKKKALGYLSPTSVCLLLYL
jgi:hypothetical protein